MENKLYAACGAVALALWAAACSDDSVSGTSVEPNTIALSSSSYSSSSGTFPRDGQPRLCRVSEMENAPAGCDWFAEMWNPESGNRVHTGFDNGTNTSGIWYWTLDTNEVLIPSVLWTGTARQDYDSLAMSDVIELCGGSICGKARFNAVDGVNGFDYEFMSVEKPASVDIAFSMAGKNASGRFDEVDASGLGGFCVGYASNGLITMSLDFSDSVDALLGDEIYRVILNRTTVNEKLNDLDYREECFAWADFANYAKNVVRNGEPAVSVENAVKHLVGVHFKINGYYDKSTLSFKIVRFGRFATANGRKALDGESLPVVDESCLTPTVVEHFCECNYADSNAAYEGTRLGHLNAVDEARGIWGQSLLAENTCVNAMWMRSTLEMPLITTENLPCDNAQPKIMQCADGSFRYSPEFASVKSRYDDIVEENALARKQVLLDRVDSCMNLSSSSVGSSSSSSFFPCCTLPSGDGDLWNGYTVDVDVGSFVESRRDDVKYGVWFLATDTIDGGKSDVYWPVNFGDDFNEGAIEPLIDHCGGVCGTAVLDEGTLSYQPYVVIGFSLAIDEYGAGKSIPIDVSNWGGICVGYTSTIPLNVELDVGDSLNFLLGFALPAAPLSKSAGFNKKCFEWSDFKLPSWAKSSPNVDQDWLKTSGWLDNAGVLASKHLAKVNFKMQSAPGMYEFNIMSIGTNRK